MMKSKTFTIWYRKVCNAYQPTFGSDTYLFLADFNFSFVHGGHFHDVDFWRLFM